MSIDRTKTSDPVSPQAIAALKKVLDDLKAKPSSPKPEDWNLSQLVSAKAAVIPRYGPVFSPANVGEAFPRNGVGVPSIQEQPPLEGIGLERRGPLFTKDMNRLREALSLLVDEGIPLRNRLERLRPRPAGHWFPSSVRPSSRRFFTWSTPIATASSTKR